MNKRYVQYGCGLAAPGAWENYDASPTLRIQQTPIIGEILKSRLNVVFSENAKYGDIIKGLPVPPNSCDGVYCSHTLEHLSLNDCRLALANTYKLLKVNGIFRCVVPDLEIIVQQYRLALDRGENDASIKFVREMMLGIESRPKGLKAIAASLVGNVQHLWMWDYHSLSEELRKIGFKEIRKCCFNDCGDEAFKSVEDEGRFGNAVAIECKK